MLVLTTSWYVEPAENEDHEEHAEHAFPGIYRKVTSSRLSRLVAHPSISTVFMKGKFDAYVLRPLAKKLQN